MTDITAWTFLIVCPLVGFGGFVDSIAGGGGLITLPAYLIAGLPPHLAMGTNKLGSMLGTIVSTLRYFINGFVDLKIAIPCAVVSIIGSSIGTNLVLLIDGNILKIILIILLPITAVFVIWNKGLLKERKELSFKYTLIIALFVAFVLGAYDGFYGPGTGTFIIISLMLLAHMKLINANGISKVINLASNVAATIVFIMNDSSIIVLGLAAGLFNAVGNFLGSKLFIDKGVKIVRPIMVVVLMALLAKIIFDTFT